MFKTHSKICSRVCEVDDFYEYNNDKKNRMFTLSWVEVKSALIYVFLTALLTVLVYVVGIGDIFKVEIKPLINIGVMSLFVGIISIIKNFLTTDSGKFLGVVKVIPETK